jgi:hypothetical protein
VTGGSQLPENTTNSVSVKVSRETYDSLNDEQARIRKTTGEKPTFQEMLDLAWEEKMRRAEGDKGDERAERHLPTAYREYPALLEELLASGDEDLIELVIRPLDFAGKRLRRHAQGRRTSGK